MWLNKDPASNSVEVENKIIMLDFFLDKSDDISADGKGKQFCAKSIKGKREVDFHAA